MSRRNPTDINPQGSVPIDLTTSHQVVVSIAFLVLVGVLLAEGAGHSKDAADLIILLLFGAFLILGMEHADRLSTFTGQYPFNPIVGGTSLQ